MSQSSGQWEDSFSVRSGQPRPGWLPSLAATSDVEGSAGADPTLNTTNSFEVVPPGQEARQNTQPMQALAMGVGLPPGLSAEETRSQRSNSQRSQKRQISPTAMPESQTLGPIGTQPWVPGQVMTTNVSASPAGAEGATSGANGVTAPGEN